MYKLSYIAFDRAHYLHGSCFKPLCNIFFLAISLIWHHWKARLSMIEYTILNKLHVLALQIIIDRYKHLPR